MGLTFPVAAVLNINTDIALVILAAVTFIFVAVLAYPALFKYEIKTPDDPESAGEEGEEIKKKAAVWDSGPTLKIITWVAAIGIVAAIALVAIKNLEEKNKLDKLLNDRPIPKNTVKPKARALGSDETHLAENDPDNFASAQQFFPKDLSDPDPNRAAAGPGTPDPDPPPAVSTGKVPTGWPMLKTFPYDNLYMGPSKPSTTFELRNDGSEILNFNLTTNIGAISVSPITGSLRTGESSFIKVSAGAEGTIIIRTNGGNDVMRVIWQ